MTAEEIVERLERGETYFGVDEIDKLALSVLGPTASIADTQLFLDAMKRGSLDAAIALVERVRPGAIWQVMSSDKTALANVDSVTVQVAAPTPAAALIAALLKAEAK